MIGPNGAGKSTTFAMMTTLIKPTSGSIKVAGFDIEKDAEKIREKIGVVPQQHSLYSDLTARENLELMGNLYDVPKKIMDERIDYYLKLVNLETHAERYTGGFSGGMKQRLSVISAIWKLAGKFNKEVPKDSFCSYLYIISISKIKGHTTVPSPTPAPAPPSPCSSPHQ